MASAASAAARAVGATGQFGSLDAGQWADVVVLGGNPLDDITNTRKIESVWIAGNRVPGN